MPSESKRQIVFNKYNGKCAYCGVDILFTEFTVDHIQPIHRGVNQKNLSVKKGTSHISNLNPSCLSCNCSKYNFTLEQWRTELELKAYRLQRDNSTFRIAARFGLIKEVSCSVVFYFERVNNG